MNAPKPATEWCSQAKVSHVKNVSYHRWEDAFAVEFDDGLSVLEPHKKIRAASKISPIAVMQAVELDDEQSCGFFIHYDNGQTAAVSLDLIRAHAPT